MTKLIDEIRKSDKKSKDMIVYLAGLIKKDKSFLDDLEESLKTKKDSERGICIEALEHVTKTDPEYAISYLEIIIKCLSDKAPRVKWEASRIIGNIAEKYPEKAASAIDNLFINTKDKGTVVRWSTAFALSEIAKHNKEKQSDLLIIIDKIIKKEKNNGVRNVYLKAVKEIHK